MPYKLSIEQYIGSVPQQIIERLYDQAVLSIGRDKQNDIQLPDLSRTVSGSHAEIQYREGKCWVIDNRSKNGTRLNKKLLIPKKEYPVAPGDEIAVGEFLLRLCPLKPEQRREESKGGDTVIGTVDSFAEVAQSLIEELKGSYSMGVEDEQEERKRSLIEILRRNIQKVGPERAGELLEAVEAYFSTSDHFQEPLLQKAPEEPFSLSLGPDPRYEAAYKGLGKIAEKYMDAKEGLSSVETAEAFIHRVDQALSIMIDSLAEAIKGRREFQQGFDVESTRIFSWKMNPIKSAEGSKEIGRYLFDVSGDEKAEQVHMNLKEVFTDLALHQVGMMGGFKEGLRGLLKELDPSDFIYGAEIQWGAFRIPCGFWPFNTSVAWTRFCEKYQTLCGEEVKTFEEILGPHFAKGYLSFQRKKRP